MKRDFKHLLQKLNHEVGVKRMVSDWEKLSHFLLKHNVNLSSSSLKKLWGYLIGKEKPSKDALNRMALLAGFQSWEELHDTFMDEKESK